MSAAVGAIREGFLLTAPQRFSWAPGGPFYVDDVAVSEDVYDLAYAGALAAARAAWLAAWDRPLA